MTGKDFKNQKLYKADLRGTNFTRADMRGASLFGAFCKDAKFNGADLSNADLESVDFEGADLSDTVLEGAQVGNSCHSTRDMLLCMPPGGDNCLLAFCVIRVTSPSMLCLHSRSITAGFSKCLPGAQQSGSQLADELE